MKEFFKNKKNVTIVIVAIIAIVGILLLLNYFINTRLSNLEKVKINEFTDNIGNYLDEIYDYEDEGKYINFAVEYLYNNSDDDTFEMDEVIDVINNYFDVDVSTDNVIDIGITDRMLSKGISYNSSDGTFKYNNSYTRLDIANMPIIKYEVKSIKKNSKNKFTIVFEKLIVENPYDILNYYNDSNSKKEITDEIFSYLKGEAKVSSIKKYVNKEHIKDMNGKVDDEIKINLIIKNDKLLVSSEK